MIGAAVMRRLITILITYVTALKRIYSRTIATKTKQQYQLPPYHVYVKLNFIIDFTVDYELLLNHSLAF